MEYRFRIFGFFDCVMCAEHIAKVMDCESANGWRSNRALAATHRLCYCYGLIISSAPALANASNQHFPPDRFAEFVSCPGSLLRNE
jgi:hypothetical protein